MKLPVGVKVFAHNQRFCGKNPDKNVVPPEILKTITEGEIAHDKAVAESIANGKQSHGDKFSKSGHKLADAIKEVEARQPGNQKAEQGKTGTEKTQGVPAK